MALCCGSVGRANFYGISFLWNLKLEEPYCHFEVPSSSSPTKVTVNS